MDTASCRRNSPLSRCCARYIGGTCGVTWIIGQRHLTAGNMQVLRVAVGVVQGYGGVDASAIGAGIFGIGDAVGYEVEVLLVGGRQ